MKLLITGGCGFLGSNLAASAIAAGHDVLVFDNLSRTGSASNLEWLKSRGSLLFVQGDTRNADDIGRAVSGFRPETVFHLAGQVAMTTSISDPRLDFETNALGTFNLLEAVRISMPSATVIYSSTNKVYGDLDLFSFREAATRYECLGKPDGFDETTPLDFRSPYGCSKGAADQYILDYARVYRMKTMVFRHSSMYGGRQFATYDQGWIGWFCQKAVETKLGLLKEPFTISGNGKQVRDVLHADDMVDLYFAAAENADRVSGRAYNVGGGMGNSLSLLELFALLEELLDVRLRYEKLPPRESDQKVFVADTSLISSTLGWRPRVTAREGIRRMLDWVEDLIRTAPVRQPGTHP